MSAPRVILASLPSFCQNYQNWWKFHEVLTKTILHSFLIHGVEDLRSFIPHCLMEISFFEYSQHCGDL